MTSLTILHTESSGVLGGQELRILAEARGMTARGHRVILVLPHGSELRPLAERAGIPVEPLVFTRLRYVPLIADFLRLFRRHAPDIVNTHGSLDSWTAPIAARMAPVRPIVIRTRHKSIPVSRTRRHRLLYRKLPDGIITTGRAVREHLMTQFDLDARKVVSIPTGVDLDRFQPGRTGGLVRKELGVQDEKPLVGTLAFLRRYKGVDDFVVAAELVSRSHPTVRFVVVGDGPDRPQLEARIRAMKLTDRCLLTGHRDDVPAVLADLDVFALASREGEGLPQALTQAMAMKRPVVATTVGGIPEVVRDGETGLLVPPREPSRLAAAIETLLTDRLLAEKLGQKAHALIRKRYSSKQMLDETESFYHRMRRGITEAC